MNDFGSNDFVVKCEGLGEQRCGGSLSDDGRVVVADDEGSAENGLSVLENRLGVDAETFVE